MITDMNLVFIILAVTTVCFLIPKFRSDMVALASLLAIYLTGIVTIEEAFSGFSNSVVIMVAALFIVGEGVFQTGLAESAGNVIVKFTGKSEFKLTIIMLLLVALLSGFMSNTGTVAILLPVIISLCRNIKIHPGRILMPLAFASSIGGTLTLIGTAPNLIANESLINYGYEGLAFTSFTAIGVIVLFVSIIYMWFIARRFLDKPAEETENNLSVSKTSGLLREYNISAYIHYVKINENSPIIGKSLQELAWPSVNYTTVLEIIKTKERNILKVQTRDKAIHIAAKAEHIIEKNDVLALYCEEDDLNMLIEEAGITKFQPPDAMKIDDSKLAEVILTPRSGYINQTIRDIHFRDKYDLTILAIKHQYEDARRPKHNDRLLFGDTMLVHGEWKDINILHEEKTDTVVINSAQGPSSTIKDPVHSIVAGMILLAMIVLMVLEVFPAAITVVIAAALMLLTRCIRHTDHAYRSVNWHTVLLIACMLPMATALEKTGGIGFISDGLISGLGAMGPIAVMAGLYVITSIFSQFISNTATAVLLYPVAILTAQQMGINPVPMVMAVAYSASMAFATPVATPPNAMIMAAGKYRFIDFLKVGVPMQIIIAVLIIALLRVFYPF